MTKKIVLVLLLCFCAAGSAYAHCGGNYRGDCGYYRGGDCRGDYGYHCGYYREGYGYYHGRYCRGYWK